MARSRRLDLLDQIRLRRTNPRNPYRDSPSREDLDQQGLPPVPTPPARWPYRSCHDRWHGQPSRFGLAPQRRSVLLRHVLAPSPKRFSRRNRCGDVWFDFRQAACGPRRTPSDRQVDGPNGGTRTCGTRRTDVPRGPLAELELTSERYQDRRIRLPALRSIQPASNQPSPPHKTKRPSPLSSRVVPLGLLGSNRLPSGRSASRYRRLDFDRRYRWMVRSVLPKFGYRPASGKRRYLPTPWAHQRPIPVQK